MSKLTGTAADSFTRKPDPRVPAVLIYGPDEGQVRERMKTLTEAICPDQDDPFRIADIPTAALREDPARLYDECSALAFGGGKRVVRITGMTDTLAAPVLAFLKDPSGDALLIVTAGALPPRSKLRAGFEASKTAAAIACYPLEGQHLISALKSACGNAGMNMTQEAIEELAARLAEDTACLNSEVGKLALYMASENRAVTAEDVQLCCGDQSEHSAFELAFAVGDGNQRAVQDICDRLFSSGESPVAIVRSISRHFDRLLLARGSMDTGLSAEDAMKKLRPPVFFKDARPFRRQLDNWTSETLLAVLDRLLETERQCKTTGIPSELITQRSLMEISALANRVRGKRAGR